ncbi:MAG: hypothetical protein EXR77_18090 [Myxococcales bacterium]|nr:hypothetical protein [Myxococcales bacterium]
MKIELFAVGRIGAAVVWSFCLLASCGEIKIDDSVSPADIAETATGSEVVTGVDTAVEVEANCSKALDCSTMKGKTPCNLPSCEVGTGKCTLKLREVGEACSNPLDEPTECQTATCDAAGSCVKASKADGAKCGTNVCGKKCAAGDCVSTSEKDYDDKLPCTKDYCDQGNEVKHDSLTGLEFPCSDNDKCTEDDICVGGQCKGQLITCTDGILCTFDSCDKAKGCVYLPDNKKCTLTDPCLNTACDLAADCTFTTPKLGICDDGNACTDKDQCNKGVCKGKPDLAKCACTSDTACVTKNTLCGGKFKCNAASKVCELDPDTVVKCAAAADGCSTNTCDATTGECDQKATNDGKECDDNNLCSTSTKCVGGACKGSPYDCDDKNACTKDSCDPKQGCAHDPATAPCDDGNKCTTDDVCTLAGICAGAKKACDDNVGCTYDACDAASGNCSNAPQDKTCDDKNSCTTDICATTGCANKPNDAGKCDDNNECTTDTCVSGACKSANACQCQTNADCDDKNPCTTDACGAGKCTYTNAPVTQGCESANKCVEQSTATCQNGVCAGGKLKVCAGDACTSASCNASTGQCESIPKADGAPCDADANGCTTKDACKSGKCSAGVPATCISTDCADVACKSLSATSFECQSKPVGKGKECDDLLFCTSGDTCDGGGKCVGAPLVCQSGSGGTGTGGPVSGANPCVPMVCSETVKACEFKQLPLGSACEDGKFCTSNDKCDAQSNCIGGAPPVCKSPGGCQLGFCNEAANACALMTKPDCCAVNTDCDDGYSCTADSCSATSASCVFTQMAACCDQNSYLNDFEGGTPKAMTFANSAGPKQGWQLTTLPSPCPPNGPECDTVQSIGKYYLYYGDAAVWNFNFGTSSGVAKLPVRKVPFKVGWAALIFSLYMATEEGNYYDNLKIYIQPLPANASDPLPPALPAFWTKSQDLGANKWHYIVADVAPELKKMVGGQNFQIVLNFNTQDAAENAGMGVLIDGIFYQSEYCN